MSQKILWTNLKKHKRLLGKNSTSKIKHEAICNDYKAGRLKNADILNKSIAPHCKKTLS